MCLRSNLRKCLCCISREINRKASPMRARCQPQICFGHSQLITRFPSLSLPFVPQKHTAPLEHIGSTQSTGSAAPPSAATQTSTSASSVPSSSSGAHSRRDEIYIDDEGLEGSGGSRGEVSIAVIHGCERFMKQITDSGWSRTLPKRRTARHLNEILAFYLANGRAPVRLLRAIFNFFVILFEHG